MKPSRLGSLECSVIAIADRATDRTADRTTAAFLDLLDRELDSDRHGLCASAPVSSDVVDMV